MPIYEYLCQACSYRFEVKQSIKDDPLTSCTRCGQDVTKLISSPAIMFKGSGWYVTDYSDKLKPAAGSEGAEKPADKAADGKPAQPAAAAETSTSTAPTPSKEAPSPAGTTSPSSSTSPTPATSS